MLVPTSISINNNNLPKNVDYKNQMKQLNYIYDNISFNTTNEILEIKFVGKSFYRYMVRNLVGAMLDVEKEKNTLEDIKEALDKPNVDKQFSTALPEGLYLNKITYVENEM